MELQQERRRIEQGRRSMKYTCHLCKEEHDDGLSIAASRILKADFEADGSKLSDTVPVCEDCTEAVMRWQREGGEE